MSIKIEISNYEVYVLDYIDGALPPDTRLSFESFLAAHPTIANEIEELETLDLTLDQPKVEIDKKALMMELNGSSHIHEDNYEMGTYPMKLTHAAANDPVFKGIPDNFMAVSVHQERCIKMPKEVELLASTDLCPHAFRVKNKDFWGFQFHPELNKENLISRLAAYQEQYTDDSNHYNSVINALSDTDDAQQLVKNFVSYVKSLMN